MAIDNNDLVYLLDPVFQIESIAGKPCVGGHLEVFYAGTDLKYITYQNFDHTENPFKIPLNNDGRAVILVEPQYTYDIYIYDSFNNMICSRLNVKPQIGGGNISITGRTYHGIEPVVVNNQYNLISARNIPLGVQEPLHFVEDSESACIIGADTSAFGGNSTLTLRTNGIKDGTYDTLGTYTPLSGSKNIDIPREVYTFTIGNQSCFYNDVISAYLNSKVLVALEIESWYEGGQQKQNVYENFAQKQFWGNDNFYNGGYVNFVRVDVEKNQIVTWKCEPETQGSITGYAKWTKTVTDLGSGGLFIAEYGNPGTTYEEIDAAFNAGKTVIAHKKDGNIDQYYQLCEIRKYPDHTPNVDCYVFAYRYSYIVEELFRFQSNWSNMATHLATWDYVDQQISAGDFATHADLSSYATQDWVNNQSYMHEYMESAFYPMESNPSGYLTEHQSLAGYMQESKLESAGGKITGYDGTAFAGGSVDPSEFIPWSASGEFQSAGNYATTDDLTAYQEKGDYYSATNPSGFINSDAISAMATTGFVAGVSADITAMIPTAVTGDYLTKDSADTLYYPLTSNPSGYLTTAEFAYYDTAISGIDNSALYDTSAHARINTLAGRISNLSSNKLDSSAFSDVSGTFLTAHQDISNLMPKDESANFYPMTGNPSGFITGVDLTPYQLTADMTAYQPVGSYLSANALDNLSGNWETVTAKLDATAFSDVSGSFLTAHQSLDGYLQNTDLGITDNKVTAISGIVLSAGTELNFGYIEI